MKAWRQILPILLMPTLGVIASVTGCATRAVPAEIVGEWFEWRTFRNPVLVLASDGSGSWYQTPITWSYDAGAKMVVLYASAAREGWPVRLSYSDQDKSLVWDDRGRNALRTQQGETPIALPVFVKGNSPIRMGAKPNGR